MRVVLLGALCALSVESVFAKVDESSSMGYPSFGLGSGMLSKAQILGGELKGDSGFFPIDEPSKFRHELAVEDALDDARNSLMIAEILEEEVNLIPGDLSNETIDLFGNLKPDDSQRRLAEAMEMMNNVTGP